MWLINYLVQPWQLAQGQVEEDTQFYVHGKKCDIFKIKIVVILSLSLYLLCILFEEWMIGVCKDAQAHV